MWPESPPVQPQGCGTYPAESVREERHQISSQYICLHFARSTQYVAILDHGDPGREHPKKSALYMPIQGGSGNNIWNNWLFKI